MISGAPASTSSHSSVGFPNAMRAPVRSSRGPVGSIRRPSTNVPLRLFRILELPTESRPPQHRVDCGHVRLVEGLRTCRRRGAAHNVLRFECACAAARGISNGPHGVLPSRDRIIVHPRIWSTRYAKGGPRSAPRVDGGARGGSRSAPRVDGGARGGSRSAPLVDTKERRPACYRRPSRTYSRSNRSILLARYA